MLEFNPYTILFTIINLLILFAFLKHFLFGKITAILDQRAQAVKGDLDQAAQEKQAAQALRGQYEAQLADARTQSLQLVAEAKARGQREYDAALAAAQADAKKLTEDTRAQLEAERQTMLTGARKEVAQLALLAAAKVAGRALDCQDDRAMVNAFLDEAEETL